MHAVPIVIFGHIRVIVLPFICFSVRSEEHTSELQSHYSISYAVFCVKSRPTVAVTRSTRSSAVSYTHLDVYKRQRMDDETGDPLPGDRRLAPIPVGFTVRSGGTQWPVSYTHLDVYKRQSLP